MPIGCWLWDLTISTISILLQSRTILATMISNKVSKLAKELLPVVTTNTTRCYSVTSTINDRIVVAVGGNALQRRGERLTIENQLKASAEMAPVILQLLEQKHQVVLTHGNGPQVGELALERSAATFDVLGAESMGQIGYCLAQALYSVGITPVPILTQVVVDAQHEAFRDPTKFVGPIYGAKEANALAQSLGWTVKADGEYFRRVVPSPPPVEILQIDAITAILNSGIHNVLPIACGGGGIPVSRVPSRPSTLLGVEAVIDKDMCGSKMAVDIEADGFIILTDGGGIWEKFGKPDAREMAVVTPEYLLGTKAGKNFPGSMGPKIQAAINFVQNSALLGRKNAWAAIGDLRDAAKIITNEEGTMIRNDESLHTSGTGVTWRQRDDTSNTTTTGANNNSNMSTIRPPPKQSQGPHKSG